MKSGMRMQIPGKNHQWIEFDGTRADGSTQFWMRVAHADAAAREASKQGFAVKRKNRDVFIDDPDGSIFASSEDH